MGLRFIAGRSGTGKTDMCLNEIAEKQENSQLKNLIFIVPEQFTLQGEKDLISKTSGRGIMKAQVISFGRLAFNVFAEKGNIKRTILNDTGKLMALRKIIYDNEGSLDYFKKSVDKQGFMEQLGLTISELFQYGISRENINELNNKTEEGTIVQRKLSDLKIIYEGYVEFLKNEYLSSDETLDILVGKMDGCKILENSEVWIDGFYGFTPQEYKVISKLVKISERVNVTLTIDEKSFYSKSLSMQAQFFETNMTAKKLIETAEETNAIVEKPVFLKEFHRFKSTAIKELESNYFYYGYKGSNECENIRIFSSANKYEEIDDTAKQILKLVRDSGFRYKDIAIVTRALEGYEKNIKGIMNEYNIPIFIDSKRDIISHPLIELARSAIDIVVHDFSYESVFRYLKTNLTGMNRNDIDILENYVLAYGIKNYKWHVEEWNYGFSRILEPDEEFKCSINSLRVQVLEPLKCLYKTIVKNKKYTVAEITRALFKLFEALNVTDTLEQWINDMNEKLNFDKAYEHSQSWNIMVEVFDEMVGILGNQVITIDKYQKILDAGLSGSDMGIIPPGADRVIIGDIERTRLPKIKALFVVGVNDGILPSASEAEGLFSETERAMIEKSGFELAHSGKRKVFEEQYLIYCGITKPEEFLSFSYCVGDLNGKSLRPSVLISRIKKMFPQIKEEHYEVESGLYNISSPIPTLHELSGKMRMFSEGIELNDIWKDAYSYFKSDEKWNCLSNSMACGITDTNQEGYLNYTSIKKLYGKEMFSSVSRLEKFVACPFNYFIRYGLKAEERKLYEISTPDLGLLFHSVLEIFAHKLKDDNILWRELTREDCDEIVEYAVDKAVPELGSEILLSTSSYIYLIKRLKRISKRAVWTLTEHIKQGLFEPFEFELGFGENEKLPPIVIELSDGNRMVMNGKIDRVDIYDKEGKKYIKIIDYKSGKKAFSIKDIYYGLQLQLMLYIDAFIKNGGRIMEGTLCPGGVFYFKISDPLIKAVKDMSGEEINNLLLKELKMTGLVLNDEAVIKAMDKCFDGGVGLNSISSDVIPVSVSVKGGLKKESSVASEQEYATALAYANSKAKEIGDEIIKGNIQINPYKEGSITPCDYCQYKSICRFDTVNKDNKYRNFKAMSKEEVWEKMNNDNI